MTTMVLTPAFPRLPRVDGAVVRQLARYGVVGVLGTAVSALLYLLFRVWWDAVPANLAALVLSTVASTEANRRFTFRGVPTDRVREYLQNAATVAFYAVYSSAVLLLLDALVDEPTALQESVTSPRRASWAASRGSPCCATGSSVTSPDRAGARRSGRVAR